MAQVTLYLLGVSQFLMRFWQGRFSRIVAIVIGVWCVHNLLKLYQAGMCFETKEWGKGGILSKEEGDVGAEPHAQPLVSKIAGLKRLGIRFQPG